MKAVFPVIFMAILIIFACTEKPEKTESVVPTKSLANNPEAMVKRGRYLVNTTGCADCHSPKIMGPDGPMEDPKRRLSGFPSDHKLPEYNPKILKDYALFDHTLTSAAGPWGTSFAANLTPDDTGIGTWTEAQFVNAIKKGKYKGLDGSRDLLPPMPWQFYSNFTTDDLKSIFAYLKTIEPVENIVPPPLPPKM